MRRPLRRPIRLLATTLLAALAGISTATARNRPVVLELFTSQGCSSCPPAEALLNAYAKRPDILPLSFHVTYWNRLGWPDTFSFEGATIRQQAYANRLEAGSSFTPQAVIDGRVSIVGSRRGEIDSALARAAGGAGDPQVALERTGAGLTARIGVGAGRARILLVGFDPSQVTAIQRGENRGRTILQSNVVRSIREIGTWSGAALVLSAPAPEGGDAALLLESSDTGIVGAARLAR